MKELQLSSASGCFGRGMWRCPRGGGMNLPELNQPAFTLHLTFGITLHYITLHYITLHLPQVWIGYILSGDLVEVQTPTTELRGGVRVQLLIGDSLHPTWSDFNHGRLEQCVNWRNFFGILGMAFLHVTGNVQWIWIWIFSNAATRLSNNQICIIPELSKDKLCHTVKA